MKIMIVEDDETLAGEIASFLAKIMERLQM